MSATPGPAGTRSARGTVLVGTFNEPGDLAPALPSHGGLVLTEGWPAAPRAVAGSGPDAPSWLVPGRPGTPSEGRLYAAQHVRRGSVAVLSPSAPLESGTHEAGWATTQRVPTAGENTCHADLNPAGTWLAAASYDSATLTVVPVLDDGRLGRALAVQAPAGSGPVPSRQEGPHLHFVLFLDDDRLLVTDLGGDRILEYSVSSIEAAADRGDADAGSPGAADGQAYREEPGRAPGEVPDRDRGPDSGEGSGEGDPAGVVAVAAAPRAVHHLPAGTGPRHLAVLPPLEGAAHPGRHLAVVGELDSRLHVLGLEPGPEGFHEVGIVPTHAQDADPESARDNLPSHLVVSADGTLVYVANRGRNTIGVIRRGDSPEFVAEVDCGGDWPRHIALAPGPAGPGLLVALEREDAVVLLPIGPDGLPGPATGRVAVRRPGFVLPRG
ncbi:hypothetical protein E7744_00690 [Citricoccus sp. SGAir0253]|uniref:lactonase family protein n=1 Tax=Citricoccus sp. SGAir0253 TaxID=2567881 RepID=UPI0010CCD7EC|nr:beta-propeller fold lactonase family protein [Citricoccus sp. SGAir0253]QCU76911.1 hypothetical protein E7744_00690 [Citricoccus sp. SGAir0253]